MAFDKVKSPVLISPVDEKPFKLIIDSSDVGTDAVSVKEASDGSPCHLFFKEIHQKKLLQWLKKETLGLVLALDHFDVYLGSTPFKIKVYTDIDGI